MEFFHEQEAWYTVAFILFVALLIYLKLPGRIATMLDERAARITIELAEARRLREEAQALLGEYQKKRIEAEQDAVNIVELAKREAEAYAHEARQKLAETIDRRTRQAEQKITQAEAQALKDVRAAATDLAISAATQLIGETLRGEKGKGLIEQSIAAVRSRLH